MTSGAKGRVGVGVGSGVGVAVGVGVGVAVQIMAVGRGPAGEVGALVRSHTPPPATARMLRIKIAKHPHCNICVNALP